MFNHVAPFHYDDGVRVACDFGKLVGNNAGFVQAIKIKVVHLQLSGIVDFADRKRWTGNRITTPQPPHEPPGKCRLAAAEIAHQLNNLTAP